MMPKGKGVWIAVGVVVLLVVWYLARRGGGYQVVPSQSGSASDAQLQAAGQGFGALANFASSLEAAQAQAASVRAEADAYLKGQALQAGAATAAADRYAGAQKAAYVWGTIRDIGVTAVQGYFGSRGREPYNTNPGFGGGVAL